jgi:hypothetical protein
VQRALKIVVIVALAASAVPVALIASVWIWTAYKTAQIDAFYRECPLLGKMQERQSENMNYPAAARDAFIQIMPLGTARDAVITALRNEGFGCQTIRESARDVELRRRILEARGLTKSQKDEQAEKGYVDCQIVLSGVVGEIRWIVDLQFDADERLIEARVAKWHTFL